MPGELAREPSAELADCPSLTFSSRGAKRTPCLSLPAGRGCLPMALPVGAEDAKSGTPREPAPVKGPLCAAGIPVRGP